MTILNNVEHGNLRYRVCFGEKFGDCVNRMQLFPAEFVEAQRDHPILFSPDENGSLVAVALLGLEKGENLHFNGQNWGRSYIPAIRRRGPFSLQVHKNAVGEETDLLVEIDLDDESIGTETGEPLFRQQGGNGGILDAINQTLVVIYEGTLTSSVFFQALQDLDILSATTIEACVADGQTIEIGNHLVIDPQRVAALSGDQLKRLNDANFLVPIIHAMTSIANIQRLIDAKILNAANG